MRVRSGINKGRRWIVGSSIHGCWLGHYEIEKQSVIRRLVKPGMRMKLFDVGANATILLALHGCEHEKNCFSLLQAGHYILQCLDGTPAHDEPLRSDEIVAFPPGASSCAG